MGKTGGGRGTNQYAVRGVSQACAHSAEALDELASDATEAGWAGHLSPRPPAVPPAVRAGCVDVAVTDGLPSFTIDGEPSRGVVETRDRVRAAMLSSQMPWPTRKIAIHPRAGKHTTDLAVAAGILEASGQLPAGACEGKEFAAELGLDGTLRPLPPDEAWEFLKRSDCHTVYVAPGGTLSRQLGHEVVEVATLRGLFDRLEVDANRKASDAAASQAGEARSHLDRSAIEERIAALQDRTEYGPNYSRGVAETLSWARRSLSQAESYPPELAAAHAAVLEAEVIAGHRPADDLAAYRNGGWNTDAEHLRGQSSGLTGA